MRTIRALVILVLSLYASARCTNLSAQTTLTVNSTADLTDANPGDGICEASLGSGVCTLRAAIQEAGAEGGFVNITLPSGTYNLSATPVCTYYLLGNANQLSENMSALCMRGHVAITGAGATSTIIDAGGAAGATCCGGYFSARGMVVSADATVSLSGLTIQNGLGSGGYRFFGGGAICNHGNLTLEQMILTSNQGGTDGGAIENYGSLSMQDSLVSGNSARSGGGLNNLGTAVISKSTFSLNSATGNGGAIDTFSVSVPTTTKIANSTLNGNIADHGGAVFNDGTLTISNSTLSGNTARIASALESSPGTADLNAATIAFNNATSFEAVTGTVMLRNTILADNVAGVYPWPNCGPDTVLNSQGHNLIDNLTGCTFTPATSDIIGQDAMLDALAFTGGTALTAQPQTHALLAGSPALDAGDPSSPGSGGTSCPVTDERGFPRPQNIHCDIGAYESVRGLTLNGVLPNSVGNSGSALLVATGSGFQPGASIRLRKAGQSDIAGSAASVGGADANISASVDLTGAAIGGWDLVVTNPDGSSITLPAALTVTTAQQPVVWTQTIGPRGVRPGSTVTFTVLYGNRGNVEADAVPIVLSVPADYGLQSLFKIAPPPSQSGQTAIDWSSVPVYVQPGPASGRVNVSVLIPVVPAGFTGVLQFLLTIPSTATHGSTFTVSAAAAAPYFDPSLDAGVVTQGVAGAISYAQTNLGATISSSATPSISQYVTNQYNLAVANGKADILANFGLAPTVYALGQFVIDSALYAAADGAATPAVIKSAMSRGSAPALTGAASMGLRLAGGKAVIRPAASGSGSGSQPSSGNDCNGKVLTPGSSCSSTNDAPKIPDAPKKFTPGDCNSIPNHYASSDGFCRPLNSSDCAQNGMQNPFFTSPNCTSFPLVSSIDPNDKVGPFGAGDQQFLKTPAPLAYSVSFENEPTASAPAQTVVVTDQLDIAHFDLSTFSFGPITVGHYVLSPSPGAKTYTAGVDLRPDANAIVRVQAGLNASSGLITWTFTSLDPLTGLLTTDPLAGFLPPDSTPPTGEGNLVYTIAPNGSFASGQSICNQAVVAFDNNAPINTPTWCNTLDTLPPVSGVTPLPAVEGSTSFTVRWSGTDAGSGVGTYTIYASDNGGGFTPWITGTTDTSATYTGQSGHSYGFYSIATDVLGNVEAAKSAAEATTVVSGGNQTITFAALANQVYGTLPITLSATASSGLQVSYTVSGPASISGSVLTITGTGTVMVTAHQAGNQTFPAATAVTQSFVVTPAVLTVTANNVSRAYGAANPNLTYTVTGFAYTDTAAVVGGSATLTTTATPTSPAGSSWPITFATQGLTAANYTFTYVPGTLTVTSLPTQRITFAALANQAYGSLPITLSATASSGLPVSFTVSGPAKVSGAILSLTGVGAVMVTASQPGNQSYAAAPPVTQGFTVTPALLTVTATNVSRAYGAANPTLTYSITGFVYTDTAAVVGGSATLTTTATATSPAGSTWPITFATQGLTAANYTFTYVPGTLTVTGGTQTVAPPAFSIPSGSYSAAQSLSLSDATPGAQIYYTLDGSVPSMASTPYAGSITISQSETVSAIAFLGGVASPLAAQTYTIGSASCTLIDYSKGFSSKRGLQLNGGALVGQNVLRLTDGKTGEQRSVFFKKRVRVTDFTTEFSFQLTDAHADGFTFAWVEDSPFAVGRSGGSLGYQGLRNSAAVKFDLYNNAGEGNDSTGFYEDGAAPTQPSIDLSHSGIDLHSGHIFAAKITYAGQQVSLTIRDTVTNAQFTKTLANIAAQGKSVWVGFTAATGAKTATQDILTWTYIANHACSGL